LYASLTQAEAAGKLGCSIRTVQIACRQYDFQWPRGRRRQKLTEDQARSIFSERARGVKASVLADQYGVSDQMVYQIVRKKSWQNATRHVFTSTL
jgi:Mor family transcriptional regulator